jgi:hypothetical protein
MKLLLQIFVALFFSFLVNCTDATGPEDSKPVLSNLKLPENFTLTCYPFQNKFLITRNDSITISFDYNSTKIAAYSIEGTIDSGKSWFTITQSAVSAANHENFIWSPKDIKNEIFKFCDKKRCIVRVATISDTVTSNEFNIIGSEPAVLIQPKKGDHYHITDSLVVQYNCNKDLLADIDIAFFIDIPANKAQFSEDSARVITNEVANSNVKKMIYFIPLQRYSAKLPDTTSPVSIMIYDYNSGSFYQIADSIIIEIP